MTIAMGKRDSFSRLLAWTGTGLVWLPIVAPVVIAILMVGRSGRWLFDYLMPAELFPFALVGGVALLGGALRARLRVRPIAWALGTAIGLLVGGQMLAVATGLASGRIPPSGVWWALVLASLGGYSLSLLALGVLGILLARGVSGALPSVPE